VKKSCRNDLACSPMNACTVKGANLVKIPMLKPCMPANALTKCLHVPIMKVLGV